MALKAGKLSRESALSIARFMEVHDGDDLSENRRRPVLTGASVGQAPETGDSDNPVGGVRQATPSARQQLTAAAGCPPVMMKLISRVHSLKSFNNLIHYLNKQGAVELVDSVGNGFQSKSELSALYQAFKPDLESGNRLPELDRTSLTPAALQALDGFVETEGGRYLNALSQEAKAGRFTNGAAIEKMASQSTIKWRDSIQSNPEFAHVQTGSADVAPTVAWEYGANVFIRALQAFSARNRDAFKTSGDRRADYAAMVARQTAAAVRARLPKRSTLLQHGIVVFPVGTNESTIVAIAQGALKDMFEADGVRYFLAAHMEEDGKNPHVHFGVSLTRPDGSKLNIRKPDIAAMRQHIAERAHEHGIELHAGKAWERGVQPKHTPQFVYQRLMRELADDPLRPIDAVMIKRQIAASIAQDQRDLAHAVGDTLSDAETRWTAYVKHQSGVFEQTARDFELRFEKDGDARWQARAQLLRSHVSSLSNTLPERLRLVIQDPEKDRTSERADPGLEPGEPI